MGKQFEIVFVESSITLTADLLEEQAPITCENFWESIEKPVKEIVHHGWECGTEIWCYVPEPKEEIPYENSTVFPEHGEILYYHFIQPPTRNGNIVYDIGIYWDRGQSKIKPGWLAGNLFARISGWEKGSKDPWNWDQIRLLRRVAARLLAEGDGTVILCRKQ